MRRAFPPHCLGMWSCDLLCTAKLPLNHDKRGGRRDRAQWHCLVVAREAATGPDLGDALQGAAAEAPHKVAPGARARHGAGAVVRAGRHHVRAALRRCAAATLCHTFRLQHLCSEAAHKSAKTPRSKKLQLPLRCLGTKAVSPARWPR